MKNYIKTHSANIVITLLILVILPFLLISIFDNPSSDDYCYASTSKDLGFFPAQINWYKTWSGRYFSNTELSFNPLTWNALNGYKIIPIILIILTFLSLYFVLKEFTENLISKKLKIILSLILLTIYLGFMPSLVGGIYWMAGSLTYQISIILLLILLIFLKRLWNNFTTSYLIISIMLSICIIGCNETIMIVTVFLILLLNAFYLFKYKKINKNFITILVFCILSSMVVILSNGNTIRTANSNIHIPIYLAITKSFYQSLKIIIEWLRFTPVFFLIFPFVFFINSLIKKDENKILKLYFNPFYSILILIFFIFLTYLPSYLSLGIIPPGRTLNITFIIFLLGWFVIIFNIYLYIYKKQLIKIFKINNLTKRVIIYSTISLSFISIMLSFNVKQVRNDIISAKAYLYNIELNNRYSQITLCRDSNIEICKVKKIENFPISIYSTDITNNNKIFINICTADYFKLKAIELDK